jgi:hypothetical protein
MKKICLTVVGLYVFMFAGFGQKTPADTTYKSRKLTFEEANLVSSYYKQDGNNSAVTGGIGTEKLTDIANVIDVKLYKWDKKDRKQSIDIEVGIDHYSSASSDRVDLKNNSSASSADTRIYPSINWTRENEKKGTTIGAGIALSSEYDYQSIGVNVNFSKKTNNRSGEFTAKAQAYLDKVSLILPVELRPPGSPVGDDEEQNYPKTSRNSYSGSFSYTQIINQRLQLGFLLDVIYQQGYLSLPFHRVYFADNSVHQENLPDTRMKIPLGLRANYFIGDKIILRSYYRYYKDDWGLSAHTFNLETPIKITPFLSISPFYRYYNQTAAKYFAPYKVHTAANEFYTSNYDVSKFSSNFYGAGFRIAPPKGVFGMKRWNMLELRYGHYTRTTGMSSDIISLNLKFK